MIYGKRRDGRCSSGNRSWSLEPYPKSDVATESQRDEKLAQLTNIAGTTILRALAAGSSLAGCGSIVAIRLCLGDAPKSQDAMGCSHVLFAFCNEAYGNGSFDRACGDLAKCGCSAGLR
jgi:hypothetical protein